MSEWIHRPVLLEESIEALNIRPDGVLLDGTLGRAGHALEIARRLKTGRLICIDRDDEAIREGAARLEDVKDRVTLLQGNFREIGGLLDRVGIARVDGMLFDLGVSSPQLDAGERGFSYRTGPGRGAEDGPGQDAPLDMRMDRREPLTARVIVNEWPEGELRRILYAYGEERYAPAIARAIVRRRTERSLETTAELVEVIRGAMPAAALREAQHPAKRSFQALRIAVNDELGALEALMPVAAERLNPGGRLVFISFHSLEDRIVKTAFQAWARGCDCPPDFPVCVCSKRPTFRLITKKPIVPGDVERAENPRARSAKLRVAERLS